MRNVALLVLVLALSWFGIGRADAACYANFTCDTRPEAYNSIEVALNNWNTAACLANNWGSRSATQHTLHGPSTASGSAHCTNEGKTHISSNTAQYTWLTECPAGKSWDDASKTCKNDCVAGQTSSATARAGSNLPTCSFPDQCTVTWTPNGAPYVVVGSDGKPTTWQQWSGVTTGGAHCTLAPDDDGDGTPNDQDSEPNNPEEHQDSDGDGIGDNNDAMPEDPTNGEDTGPGDESDNTSSGGGSCASPPVSTGDAIAAQIAYQAWATRCAVEKLNGTATTGSGIKIQGSSGGGGTDLTETNAKLDGIKGSVDGIKNGDGEGNGLTGAPAMPWVDGTAGGTEWSSGLASNGTCPAPISTAVNIAGLTAPIEFSFDPICQFADLLRPLIIALGLLVAGYIVAGVRR